MDLPAASHRSVAAARGRLPAAADVTLHGTGINPGGITERFPLMLSALCRDIRHVRAEEFSDIRTYPTESVVRDVMLFGTPPEQAATSPMLDDPRRRVRPVDRHGRRRARRGRSTPRSARRTRWRSRPADLDTPVGVIDAGTVAAQRFTWEGLVDGEPVITVRVNWLMGEEHLDPAVDARTEASASRSSSTPSRRSR